MNANDEFPYEAPLRNGIARIVEPEEEEIAEGDEAATETTDAPEATDAPEEAVTEPEES